LAGQAVKEPIRQEKRNCVDVIRVIVVLRKSADGAAQQDETTSTTTEAAVEKALKCSLRLNVESLDQKPFDVTQQRNDLWQLRLQELRKDSLAQFGFCRSEKLQIIHSPTSCDSPGWKRKAASGWGVLRLSPCRS
jgi:hypothetical protein